MLSNLENDVKIKFLKKLENGILFEWLLAKNYFLSTTEFTVLLRTIILQGWVLDVCMLNVCRLSPFHFHDGITSQSFELKGWDFLWVLIM